MMGDKIVALGVGKVAGQYLSIDHPEPNSDADWHFDDTLPAAFILVHPYGDRYHIITRFRKQQGDVVSPDDLGMAMSCGPDGE